VNPHRQEGPHAHSVTLDAAGRFVFAADLGMDKIMVYRLSEPDGVLEPNEPPFAALTPGSGPRHFAFHPNGRFAYVINELSNTVAVFEYDADAGKLTHVETVNTLPEDFKGDNTTAEVRVHPSGRFVYGSNRGHDSIAVFQVNGETGGLTPAGHTSTGGKTPRNFGIDPSGRYLLAANQDTGNVVAFAIDRETGALTATGQEISVARPVCVTFCAGK
jgi:6-phosphogluconolactonase